MRTVIGGVLTRGQPHRPSALPHRRHPLFDKALPPRTATRGSAQSIRRRLIDRNATIAAVLDIVGRLHIDI
jgi:hypothetical protein